MRLLSSIFVFTLLFFMFVAFVVPLGGRARRVSTVVKKTNVKSVPIELDNNVKSDYRKTDGNNNDNKGNKILMLTSSSDTTTTGKGIVEAPEHDEHMRVNLALNRTVRLSTSPEASKSYALQVVDGDASTGIVTAFEESPFLVVDLGLQAYVDEISIVTGEHKLQDLMVAMVDDRNVALTKNMSEFAERANWIQSFATDFATTVCHVHATGRFVRVHKTTPGRLRINEVEVWGVPLASRQKSVAHCLSGEDGTEICSSNGACVGNRCVCNTLTTGSHCEEMRRFPLVGFFYYSIVIGSVMTNELTFIPGVDCGVGVRGVVTPLSIVCEESREGAIIVIVI